MFSEPKLKVVFLACCVWVGKGICPGQKLVLQMALHMFQNFFFSFIIGFVEVAVEGCGVRLWVPQSCFLPPESRAGPGRFQPCGTWVEPSFTFPGAVGVSLGRLLDLAALLCLRKENDWIPVN